MLQKLLKALKQTVKVVPTRFVAVPFTVLPSKPEGVLRLRTDVEPPVTVNADVATICAEEAGGTVDSIFT